MAQATVAQRNRENSFGFLIQTLSRRIDANLRQRLEEIGIDARIFANLMVLSEEDGVNQRQIGAKLDFPEYYTSRNIDVLVERGLAERRPDPNSRRTFLVYLTEAGREKANQLPDIIAQTNLLHFRKLAKAEQKQLVELLKKATAIDPHN